MVGCEEVENPVVPANNDNGEDELKFWDGSFANREWKKTTGYNGPQAYLNSVYCSSSLDNVWVDGQSPRRLHLKITYDDKEERWNCAQIESVKTLGGYGKYTFCVDNIIMEKQDGKKYNATELDKNVVIGLYTYDNGCSHPSKNEIDLEFSEWGDSGFEEGWFIVWKDGDQLLRDRCNFPIQLVGKSSEHSFDWTENSIDFESASGSYKKTAQYPSNAFENLGGNGYIPQPQNEKVLMNIWLDGGRPYSDDMKSAEIIISNFEYSSNDQTENHPPDITSSPVTSATKDEPYSYDVNATDPDDGDTLTYSLTVNPTGMNINSSTGAITWTPTTIGDYDVTVKVSDGELFETQSFTIVVSDPQPDSANKLFLQSGGALNGISINPSNPVLTVNSGGSITGTLKVQAIYSGPSNNVVPFGYTPSWGSHSSSYVTVKSDLPVGTTTYNVSVNLNAPSTSGTYFLIFATSAEMNLGWTMSRTNWTTGTMSWNDGKDIADLTESNLDDSLSTGYLYLDMLEGSTYKKSNYGIAYVKIIVTEDGTYALCDIGPAGGYIFYDKGTYSDGWRYLEAAPVSTEWNDKQWGSYGTLIGGTETGIGTGQSNTTKIVTWLNSHSETDRAAQLCDALVYGGYSDWFLPSKEEQKLMYTNLDECGVGSFADDRYWSSSERDAEYAWGKFFDIGYTTMASKSCADRVRAVRAF